MELVWKIVYVFLISGLELFIFFKVDGIVLTLERFFKAFLFKLLLAVVLVTINYIVGNTYLSYFVVPLYGIGLSFLLLRGLPKKLLFFPNGGSCMIARYKVREVSEAINNLH